MADVFISYARTERAEAESLKTRLEAMGLSVFLDVDGLDGGDVFSAKLDQEVKTAGCVLGLWSPTSLARPWVQIECDIGKRRGVLVPVAIHPFRDMEVPAPFWNIQFVDLSDALHDDADPNWPKLRRALARTLKRPDLSPPARLAAPAEQPRAASRPAGEKRGLNPLVFVIPALLIVAAAAGVLITDPFGWRTASPPAQVAATSANTEAPPAQAAAVIPPPSAPANDSAKAADTTGTAAAPPPATTTPQAAPLQARPAAAKPAPTPPPVAPKAKYTIVLEKTLTTASKKLVATVQVLSGGARLMTIQSEDKAYIWNLATSSVEHAFGLPGEYIGGGAVSPDGRKLALISAGRIRFFNVDTGANLNSIEIDEGGGVSLAWSPDSSRIAVGTYYGPTYVYDAATGARAFALATPRIFVKSIAYSPDGKLIVTGQEGVLSIWDASTGRALRSIEMIQGTFKDSLGALAFSRDGRLLAAGGSNYTAHIWSIDSWTERQKRPSYGDWITSLDFSPAGDLALAGTYITADIWDGVSSRNISLPSGPATDFVQARFSPDGRHLYTGDREGRVLVWRLDPN